MIRSIRHRRLKRFYERGDASRLPPQQIARIRRVMTALDAASGPGDMDLPGYRLHPLKGDRKGTWAVDVSGNWRITFRFEDGDVLEVDLVDYH